MSDLGPDATALHLAAALRAKELSSVELVDACLAAVDARNPELNAVIWRDDDEADARLAAGDPAPFLGVPIPVKDLNRAAGQPCTYGSNGAPDGVADESDLSIEKLVEGGFVLCGRTATPEFGVITATETARYGITRNPWDTERSPGGSSGGAGAATAAGMFPLAHATDGGGSIRIPAAYCGLVGLKPSRGRVPDRAHSWVGAAVELAVTHTIADAAAVLDVMAGPDPLGWYSAPAPSRPFSDEVTGWVGTDFRLRVGVMATLPLGVPTDPACVRAAQDVAALLAELGHDVGEVEVPTLSEEMIGPFIALTQAGLGAFDPIDWERTEPHVRLSHELGSTTLSAIDYVQAVKALELLSRREAARWGRDFDVLLTPTSGILPPPAGSLMAAAHSKPAEPSVDVIASVGFTAFGNVVGLPAISLPLQTTDDDLPVGVMLTGGAFDEATLIRLGAQLEQARPWAGRRPALAPTG